MPGTLSHALERKTAAIPYVLLSLVSSVLFPFDDVFRGMVAAGQGIEALCAFLQLSRSQLDDHLVRLGLATPHDRPLRIGGYKAWSVWDVIQLISWRIAGVHPEIIGLKLGGRSAASVRSKCRRLGLRPPPRKLLHKPDPSTLHNPEPGFGRNKAEPAALPGPLLSSCGQIAGKITWRSGEQAIVTQIQGVSAAAKASSSSRGVPGQCELAILGPVGGTDHTAYKSATIQSDRRIAKRAREIAEQSAPKTESEIDFAGDFTWISKIRRPLTNKVAVWVCGMLLFGGLHYKEAATRVGMKPAAFRTFRTRCAIPVDDDRSKFGSVFDEKIARDTLAHSRYKLKECTTATESKDGRGNWFWIGPGDHTRFSPPKRSRNHHHEGRFNRIKILKGADAQSRLGEMTPPFAKALARNQSNNSWSAAHA